MALKEKPDKKLTPLETLIMNVLWDNVPLAAQKPMCGPCPRRRTGGSLNPLIRRIPTMNAFAAAKLDLALRIRRTLGSSAHRMGTRAHVLAAVLLCPLAAVTLPSCGTTYKVSKVAAEPSRDENLFSNTSGDAAPQTEKLDLKVESAPRDSLVKIAYWIPEMVNRDSVFIELDCFNMEGMQVAQPVNKTHAPGSHTVFLSKRGLPDGIYYVRLRTDRSEQDVMYALNLIWTNRK